MRLLRPILCLLFLGLAAVLALPAAAQSDYIRRTAESVGFRTVYTAGIDIMAFNYGPYAQKLKDAGVASPYVAYWIKEFCEEYLMVYLLAEGITPFDDAGNPVFADDPKSVGVMDWWAAMFQDKLTTETMLTDSSRTAASASRSIRPEPSTPTVRPPECSTTWSTA